ncbi:hypothetical protein RN001_007581 [Aquatica leii]|uniref:Large ribosomal subunit protein uL10m n=1 Tax=Aquatica leii TaxID=1421715 RepID=A0AAN7SQZ8_9COLE|nr:hypothetical protein RN001_007581 [Aquatica leii]
MSWTIQPTILKRSLPLIQAKRLRGKINIQKPKAPHHVKATFLEFTKPRFINPNLSKTSIDLCKNHVKFDKDQDNPFQRIIAGELYRWFQNSRLVAFFHMNPMSADQQFKAYLLFKKQNMHFKSYGKQTMKMALEGTAYEAALSLYISRNLVVFSPEPEIKKMLKAAKRFPQIVLLAAIFEGKFVSKDELMQYSLIPNLETAQANLVHTLSSIGGQLVGQLNTHQNSLVSNLEERIKQLKVE